MIVQQFHDNMLKLMMTSNIIKPVLNGFYPLTIRWFLHVIYWFTFLTGREKNKYSNQGYVDSVNPFLYWINLLSYYIRHVHVSFKFKMILNSFIFTIKTLLELVYVVVEPVQHHSVRYRCTVSNLRNIFWYIGPQISYN